MDGFEYHLAELVKILRGEYWNFAAEHGGVMTESAYIRARVMNELEYAIRETTERENASA